MGKVDVENWTGGVDLTSIANGGLTDSGEHLAALNAEPDVVETLTGYGEPGVAGSVHLEQPHPVYTSETPSDVAHGLHLIPVAYSGHEVRVRPASRWRTQRYTLAPGAALVVAQRDNRRLRTIIIATSLTATDVAYVGSDQTTAATMGIPLPLNTYLTLQHGDIVGVAASSGNNIIGMTVSVAQEILEEH